LSPSSSCDFFLIYVLEGRHYYRPSEAGNFVDSATLCLHAFQASQRICVQQRRKGSTPPTHERGVSTKSTGVPFET
jgi:hypothetical protein